MTQDRARERDVLPRRLALALLALFAVCAPDTVAAQARETREQVNGWFVLNNELQLTPRWYIDSDLNLRRSGPYDELAQVLPRVSFRFQPMAPLRFSWGYAFAETWPYGKLPVAYRAPEHRMWEQVQLGQSIGRVGIAHRYRLEQRWLGHVVEENGDTHVADWVRTNRARYRALATIPLQGRTLDNGEFYATAGDEVFINWGANVQRNVLDQNRLQASLGRRFSKSLRLELGYLEQLIQKSDGRRLERNDTIVLSAYTAFSLVDAPPAAPAR